MENRKLLRALPYGSIILLAVIARLIPHAPNFAPIGGLALFSGAQFKNKIAWFIPIAAMVISDLFLGLHPAIPFVYGSFLIISFVGSLMRNDKFKSIFLASLISSLIFFFITNFGVWATTSMYPKTFSGLIDAYILGIPFIRNTVLSDLIYTFSFFYGFRYLSNLLFRKVYLRRPGK